MEKLIENVITMLMTAHATFRKYLIIWTGFTAMEQYDVELEGILNNIEHYRSIQDGKATGTTADKEKRQTDMVNAALMVAAGIWSYAIDTENHELAEKSNFVVSKFDDMRDTERVTAAELIRDLANDNIAALSPYKIIPPVITDLNNKIDSYRLYIPKPKMAINTKAGAKIEVINLKNKAKLIFKKVDKLMEFYKVSNPDFYEEYFRSRNIIDLGHRTRKPVCTIKGLVIDFETEKPCPGAKIYIMGDDSFVTSDLKGNFELPVKTTGKVIIMAELNGYTTWEDEEEIVKNEDIEMNIDLEKIQPSDPSVEPTPSE
jgi:hypothetical protein